jgi:periplasmic mercuric ion binding protein
MKTLSAIFPVLLLILTFNIKTIVAQDTNPQKSVEIKIQTSAICGSCKTRIEDALNKEKGVTAASLDLSTKIVTVTYKPAKTDPDKIRLVISNVGYDADNVPANKDAYSNLPACCKKN